MKIFILIILLSIAAQAETKVDFELAVSYDGVVSRLKMGYADSATIDYDEKYEQEIPPFPPPGSAIPSLRINRVYKNGTSELIYSNADYRPVPTVDTVDYVLDMLGNRDENTEFFMAIPQSTKIEGIEEIRIIDVVLKGKLIDSNIIDGKKLIITNRFIDKFIVRVKYKLTPTSVREYYDDNSVYYSSNNIYNTIFGRELELYNANGQKSVDRVSLNNNYDMQNLPNGIYFAYIYERDVVIKILKIVKL